MSHISIEKEGRKKEMFDDRRNYVNTVVISEEDLEKTKEEVIKLVSKLINPFVYFYYSDKGKYLVITTEMFLAKDYNRYYGSTRADFRNDSRRPEDVYFNGRKHRIQDVPALRMQGRSDLKRKEKKELGEVIDEWVKNRQKPLEEEPNSELEFEHAKTLERHKTTPDVYGKTLEQKTPHNEIGNNKKTMVVDTVSKYASSLKLYKNLILKSHG